MFGFAGIPAMNAASLYYLKKQPCTAYCRSCPDDSYLNGFMRKIEGRRAEAGFLPFDADGKLLRFNRRVHGVSIDGSFNLFVYFRLRPCGLGPV